MKRSILFAANLESFYTKFLIPQLRWFHEHDYEVHIAAKSEGIEIPYCDRVFDVDFARGLNPRQNCRSYRQMRDILTQHHYDMISCHTPFGGAITRLAAHRCKLQDTRVVYMAHGFHFYKGAPRLSGTLFYWAEKFLARYTDALITINRDDYDVAREKFKTNVRYVPGVGMDPEKFNAILPVSERGAFRASLGLTPEDFVLIYPAELLPRKRQTWLLETLQPLFAANPHYHLLLPGQDSMNGACQALAATLGMDKQVHFLGFRRDMGDLLAISDLAVTSSKQEGLPVNVMEAIYMGLPVVATACRGNRDLITSGTNGYIVDLDDAEGFRAGIQTVYDFSPAERAAIRAFDEAAIQKYLVHNVLAEIVGIYIGD